MNTEMNNIENELLDEMELTGFEFDFSLLLEPNFNFELEFQSYS